MSTINEKTNISIAYAGITLLTIIGGIAWLTEIRSIAKNNVVQIERLEQVSLEINRSRASYRSRLWDSIRTQDERLARIEGKLDVLIDVKTR